MLSKNIQFFFCILQLAVGKHLAKTIHIKINDWYSIYDIAVKQSLIGVMMEGIQKLSEIDRNQKPPFNLLCEWIGLAEQIKLQNKLMDEKSAMLTRILNSWGYDSCILKGQGVARLYSNPVSRQFGDIDIWVKDNKNDKISEVRDSIVGKIRAKDIEVTAVNYVNCHAGFFDDTIVEVHFRPTWFYNPFVNRKLQKWIQKSKKIQMKEFDSEVGFGYPTIAFNLVFSLLHIYKHVFEEGIGLRQLTDYYFILTHSTDVERSEAYDTLKSFGVGKFAASIMHIMRRVFNIDESLILCKPNAEEGQFLLSEIMRGGNFGRYDDRNEYFPVDNKIQRGFLNTKRNLCYLKHYPSEVLWMPLWKMWHWCWRKSKRYL